MGVGTISLILELVMAAMPDDVRPRIGPAACMQCNIGSIALKTGTASVSIRSAATN